MASITYICGDCGHHIELDESVVEANTSFECEECAAEYVITSEEPFRAEAM